MKGMSKRVVFVCLSVVFSLLVFTGCRDSGKESVIKGWVSTGEPLAGAQLYILDSNGEKVWESNEPATGDTGSFILEIKNLPDDFRIIAEGEMGNERTRSVRLTADYRGFDCETDIIYINVPSTMVSAYIDKNPDAGIEEAKEAVAAKLNLPVWVEPGKDTHTTGKYFSYDVFMDKADGFENLSSYIDHLSESGDTHSFKETEAEEMLQGIGGTIATSLAKGAASYVGTELTGWALKEMGIGFKDATQDQLNQLQAQMDRISGQIDQMRSEMKEYYERLKNQIDKSSYNTRVGQIDIIDPIMSIKEDMDLLASNPYDNKDKKLLDDLKEGIKTAIQNDILTHVDEIHNQLVGVGGQEPLLKLWSNIIKNRNRFLSYEDSMLVQNQYEYFRQLQEYILLLQVEYFHAIGEEGDNIPRIEAALEKYDNNITEQQKLILKPIPEGLVICIYNEYGGNMYTTPVKMYPMEEDIRKLAASYHYDQHLGYDKWMHMEHEQYLKYLLENCGGSSETFTERLLLKGWGEKNTIPDMDKIAVTYKEPRKELGLGEYIPESIVYKRYNFNDGNWYRHYVTTNWFNESEALKGSDWFTFFIYRNFTAEELAEYFW